MPGAVEGAGERPDGCCPGGEADGGCAGVAATTPPRDVLARTVKQPSQPRARVVPRLGRNPVPPARE